MAGADKVLVVGDWNGDGYVDTMAHETATGKMWLYPGRAPACLRRSGRAAGPGWADRIADHRRRRLRRRRLARPDGPGHERCGLSVPGSRRRRLRPRLLVRSSLPAGATMFGVGRWTGDGAPDVVRPHRSGPAATVSRQRSRWARRPDPARHAASRLRRPDRRCGDLTGDGRPDLRRPRRRAATCGCCPGSMPAGAAARSDAAVRRLGLAGSLPARLTPADRTRLGGSGERRGVLPRLPGAAHHVGRGRAASVQPRSRAASSPEATIRAGSPARRGAISGSKSMPVTSAIVVMIWRTDTPSPLPRL